MRKYLLVTLALAGLVAALVTGFAAARGNKEEACVDNLCFKAGGKFKPKKLSKKKQTPIGLVVEGRVKTTDGSHPPALREAIIETDKNGAINVAHYPKCDVRKIQSVDTRQRKRRAGRRSSAKARRPLRSLSPNRDRSWPRAR